VSVPLDSLATESFLDGVALFATDPDHVLLVLAASLLAGQRGSHAARAACLALPLAWTCGGLAGLTWPTTGTLRVPLIASFLIAGALVALDASSRIASSSRSRRPRGCCTDTLKDG
jgi:hypothetical protein